MGWLGAYDRTVVRRRVIVNLVGGTKAIDGTLVRQVGPLLILKGATYLEEGQQPVSLDGEVVIERDRVDFIQAL